MNRRRNSEDGLTAKEKEIILAYANNDMVLINTAADVGLDFRTVAAKLDIIYKVTKLNPRKFFDLIKLVQMVEEERANADTG